MAKYENISSLRASLSNPVLPDSGVDIQGASIYKPATSMQRESNVDVNEAYKNLSAEEQKQLKKLLDLKEPGAS